jgi:hypothetical protein
MSHLIRCEQHSEGDQQVSEGPCQQLFASHQAGRPCNYGSVGQTECQQQLHRRNPVSQQLTAAWWLQCFISFLRFIMISFAFSFEGYETANAQS